MWLVGFFSGWADGRVGRPHTPPTGHVILLPGIEGTGLEMRSTLAGLRDAGITHALEPIMWGSRPLGSLRNLVDLSANRAEADAVAERISEIRTAHPDLPVTVIAYSGGCGVALFAAEALPDGVHIDRIVLVAAAVTPTYNLAPALAKCRDGIISIYSHRDWFILGLGTSLLGTIDRAYVQAAGKVGFLNGDGMLRREPGLTQIAWRDAWRALGHYGGHLGCYSRPWAREVLAPQIAGFIPSTTAPTRAATID